MGSIQETNSLLMEMASESRDVEMRDSKGDGPSNATGEANRVSDARDRPESNKHVINGHMISEDNLKGENGASHSLSTSSNRFHNSSIPIPSVEKDDDHRSPSTVAEHEEKTFPSEGEQKENILSSSPAQPRHQSTKISTSDSIKIDKEIARLNEVLSETSAQAAQRVLHDKWRFFLFDQYDENHISFILRAGFKNAPPNVFEKVLRDSTILKDHFLDVASRKPGVIEKVISNATVSQLGYLPQRVLDKALAERLKTVSAKELIKWLAEADRLGYKLDDIIDEDDESVIPNQDTDMTDEVFEVEPPPPQLASSHRDPLLAQQEINLAAQRTAALKAEAIRQQQQQQQKLQQQQEHLKQQLPPPPPQSRPMVANLDIKNLKCPLCRAQFPSMTGYNYHITKKPCQKQALLSGSKWWCMNCVQAFTTKQGMEYHKENKVCFADDIAPPTSPSSQLQQEAQSRPQPPPPTESYGGPILPPPRPSFAPQPPPAQSMSAPYPTQYSQPQPRPPITVQRPPLHTPTPAANPTPIPTPPVSTPAPKKQSIPDDVRHSPSELSPEKLAALERELQEAEDRYQQLIAEIPASYTEAERNHRLTSLKNANASRKSQIRKAHGVSLRLREKDKVARKAAGITPPSRPRTENRASPSPAMGTPKITPPISSFSPVNAPPRSSSGPPHPSIASEYNSPSGHASHSATNSLYKPPPLNASIRVQNMYSEPHPNTLTHALEARTPASGFGILRVSNPQHVAPTKQSLNSNKRRRSPEDDDRPMPPRTKGIPSSSSFAPNLFDQGCSRSPAQSYTPALSMMQVKAEDAASKLARKTPLAEGQKQPSPSTTGDRNTPMTEAPSPLPVSTQNPKSPITNTKETAIAILSSSESESEPQPISSAPGFHPAIRDLEKEKKQQQEQGGDSTEDERREKKREETMDQKRGSGDGTSGVRRGFMAKRGGKH